MVTRSEPDYAWDFCGGHLAVDFTNTVGDRGAEPQEHFNSYGDVLSWAETRRVLGAAEARRVRTHPDVRRSRVRVALRRRDAQPHAPLVRHGGVRQSREGPALSRIALARPRSSTFVASDNGP